MDVYSLENQYTSGVYAKREITIVRGQGALLYDSSGREYIDCIAGQGVANLGHCHPEIVNAINEQARTLITCPEMFYNDRRAEYMSRLIQISPPGLERVFLCNSGAEAVEAAIKFSRLSTGRREIISAMRGFHGRTFGALSATWNKKYREPFEPLVPDFQHTPYNNLERLEKAVTNQTAAVILEVIQGEGGINPGKVEFLKGAQKICRERGALLIIDEVQTGFGRTGKMFALEYFDLQPDIICLAKSIAGGLPMGAVLIGERVNPPSTGSHGSTFGGNPLACAAALAVLDVMGSEHFLQRTKDSGDYLISQLNELSSPLVREIRGMGLMVGIEIKQKVAPFLQMLMLHGVLALPAGMTVIRLLPPLVISKSQIDRVIHTLQQVLVDGKPDD